MIWLHLSIWGIAAVKAYQLWQTGNDQDINFVFFLVGASLALAGLWGARLNPRTLPWWAAFVIAVGVLHAAPQVNDLLRLIVLVLFWGSPLLVLWRWRSHAEWFRPPSRAALLRVPVWVGLCFALVLASYSSYPGQLPVREFLYLDNPAHFVQPNIVEESQRLGMLLAGLRSPLTNTLVWAAAHDQTYAPEVWSAVTDTKRRSIFFDHLLRLVTLMLHGLLYYHVLLREGFWAALAVHLGYNFLIWFVSLVLAGAAWGR